MPVVHQAFHNLPATSTKSLCMQAPACIERRTSVILWAPGAALMHIQEYVSASTRAGYILNSLGLRLPLCRGSKLGQQGSGMLATPMCWLRVSHAHCCGFISPHCSSTPNTLTQAQPSPATAGAHPCCNSPGP